MADMRLHRVEDRDIRVETMRDMFLMDPANENEVDGNRGRGGRWVVALGVFISSGALAAAFLVGAPMAKTLAGTGLPAWWKSLYINLTLSSVALFLLIAALSIFGALLWNRMQRIERLLTNVHEDLFDGGESGASYMEVMHAARNLDELKLVTESIRHDLKVLGNQLADSLTVMNGRGTAQLAEVRKVLSDLSYEGAAIGTACDEVQVRLAEFEAAVSGSAEHIASTVGQSTEKLEKIHAGLAGQSAAFNEVIGEMEAKGDRLTEMAGRVIDNISGRVADLSDDVTMIRQSLEAGLNDASLGVKHLGGDATEMLRRVDGLRTHLSETTAEARGAMQACEDSLKGIIDHLSQSVTDATSGLEQSSQAIAEKIAAAAAGLPQLLRTNTKETITEIETAVEGVKDDIAGAAARARDDIALTVAQTGMKLGNHVAGEAADLAHGLTAQLEDITRGLLASYERAAADLRDSARSGPEAVEKAGHRVTLAMTEATTRLGSEMNAASRRLVDSFRTAFDHAADDVAERISTAVGDRISGIEHDVSETIGSSLGPQPDGPQVLEPARDGLPVNTRPA